MTEALETTLDQLDLTFESAAIVSLCRLTAERLDTMPLHIDAYATVCNSYMRQLAELRQWVRQPEVVTEDPFDALARSLERGTREHG